MVLQNSILGGPRPDKASDSALLQEVNTSNLINSENPITSEKCGCNSPTKECSCKNGKNIGECVLKIAIVLSVFTAGYLLIKK